MTAAPNPSPQLPLTESTFLILLSLAPGPSHGYAILKDVQQLSEQRVRLSTGTLYGALKRLLDDGWIERVEAAAAAEGGRTTHTYRLTAQGRRVLGAEQERMQALAEVARRRLAGEPR
jgi:DNA-binding PadR family transcriptional regulator